MRTCLGFALLISLPASLVAQRSPIDSFVVSPPGIASRLEEFKSLNTSGTQMTAFAVDRWGFLWCRTNNGLARFDGYDVRFYHEDNADTTGAFRLEVRAIAVDDEGYLWGGTPNGGVCRIDPSTGKSRWYRGAENDPTSIGAGATVLLVTSDGEVWAGAKYGLARYNRQSDTFTRYKLPPDYPPVRDGIVPAGYIIISLCELERSIWVGLSSGGLAEFNRDSRVWKRYPQRGSNLVGPSGDVVRALCADRAGRLWMGTRNCGIDRYDPRAGTWDHFSVYGNRICPVEEDSTRVRPGTVWAIVEDDFGGMWILVVGGGLFRFDPATGESVHYRHDSTDVNSIPSNFLLYMGKARARTSFGPATRQSPPGNWILWISPSVWSAVPSGIGNIHRAIVRKNPCTSVLTPHMAGTLPIVSALVHNPPGIIWGGHFNGGIVRFDLLTRTAKSFTPVPGGGIRSLYGLRDGTILASAPLTFATSILEPAGKTLAAIAPDLRVTAFLEENDSLVWFGCRSNAGISYLASFNRRTRQHTVYPRQDPDSASHCDQTVTEMCRDERGDIWYGTEGGGLIHFDVKRKTYHRYAADPGSNDALLSNGVNSLVPDSGGKIWVGTIAGLALMNCERGTFENIRSSLPESDKPLIRDMADDGEGHLWIAANEGAFCFTKSTRAFRVLVPPPEFQNSRFWSAVFEPQTRTVAVGGTGGFFFFPVDDPPAASPPPPVVLASFEVLGRPYPLDAEIWALKSITLPHSASHFSFTFAALDYTDPLKNQYAYRLEGFDPSWVQAGTRRYAGYTNLDPGTYVFRVRGANSEGIWNEEGTAIEITILPPWYRSTWAYIAYVLFAGGLLYGAWQFDRRRVALKHTLEMKSFEAAKMREVDQMKSAFFANISHEFRTPLTLILGPLEQFAERFRNDERAQATLSAMRRNGLRLLQLINQLLDLSRMDAGKMTVQVRPIELVAFSRALVMSFLSLAERKKITLIFDPEDSEIIAYADRDKFEKILTNLLSNAFKFTGEAGEVKVVLRILNGGHGETSPTPPRSRQVEVVVSDTGIGIDAAHLDRVFDRFYQVENSHRDYGGTGIGLALTKEVVDLLRGEISVRSAQGQGSTFTVRLPIDKELWRPEEIAAEEQIPSPAAIEPSSTILIESDTSAGTERSPDPGKPVLLVVEDNADVRTYLRGLLEKDFAVEEAENGKTGLEKAREMGIDLVISDIMMPVMDGMQLCRELKGDDRTSHIPVILLTARATQEGKLEGLDVGADDYVTKPFDMRELRSRAKNLIDTRRKLWEKYHRQVTLGPSSIPVTSADERFLKRLAECIEQHLAEASYDSESLAHDLCMSRMQLNRKLNALTGKSTHEVVREFRLQRAAELLRRGAGNVSSVAYEVGFNSPSHFASAFRQTFGLLPSEYAAGHPSLDTDSHLNRLK